MTEPIEPTWVSTSRIEEKSWEDLAHKMISACWRDDVMVFVYTEALDDCRLECCKAQEAVSHVTACAPSHVANLLEGRIFDSEVEFRWRRLRDDRWAAWTVRELEKVPEAANDSSSDLATRAWRTDRRYYLLGTYDETARTSMTSQAVFREARYAKRFDYPVTGARAKDRAYIEVAEYRRIEPTWSEYSDDDAVDRINAALARPLLFAHRFVRVGAGADRKEG